MNRLSQIIVILIAVSAATSQSTAQAGSAEVLLRQHNCLACHRSESAVTRARIAPLGAPDLSRIGERASPNWLRTYLTEPDAAKPGTTMPHVLGDLDPADQKGIVEDLVHYLSGLGGPLRLEVSAIREGDIESGRILYETTGCVVCHGRDFSGHRLAEKTTVASLSQFLHSPLHTRPSGRMPSLRLTKQESQRIATYLLRHQFDAGANNVTKTLTEGFSYDYFEQSLANAGEAIAAATPTRSGHIKTATLPKPHRPNNFGFRLRAQLRVNTSGIHTFILESDDGSRLWIDGALIINHDGIHATQKKTGRLQLETGLHTIKITMFEASGGERLNLEWEGPGFKKRMVGGKDVVTEAKMFMPLGYQPLTPNEFKAKQGKALYLKLRCINCHGDPEREPIRFAKGFEQLEASPRDCLSDNAGMTLPDFHLTAKERSTLREALKDRSQFEEPRSASESIAHTMTLLNCVACHSRDGYGGPGDDINDCFRSTAELGDEGRLPPDLSQVGHKLRESWTSRVLEEGLSVRPYMVTRMPIFGQSATNGLAAQFTAADSIDFDSEPPPFSIEAAEVGRRLVGSSGFTCVVCHEIAGQPSTGVPAIDLATCNERLKPMWFRKSLLHPGKVNPGTRMPAFWEKDAVGFPDLLGGSPVRQIDAIWSYLSLGDRLPLPKGIGIISGTYDLLPVARPVGFGVFMNGVSPKTVAIGFPERVHIAFDKEAPALARVWRGAFMNAKGTWHGRAGKLSSPAGTGVIRMPKADVVAPLLMRDAPWPEKASLRYVARHTGRSNLQGFSMRSESVAVKEEYVPKLLASETVLIRRLSLTRNNEKEPEQLYALAARDAVIEKTEDGYLINAAWRCRVRGGEGFIVKTKDGHELRVAIPKAANGQEVIIELEIGWPFSN